MSSISFSLKNSNRFQIEGEGVSDCGRDGGERDGERVRERLTKVLLSLIKWHFFILFSPYLDFITLISPMDDRIPTVSEIIDEILFI